MAAAARCKIKAAINGMELHSRFHQPDYKRTTDAEMAGLAKIDKSRRLIKGPLFLWRDGQTW